MDASLDGAFDNAMRLGATAAWSEELQVWVAVTLREITRAVAA
ncbi:MAG TPA: hypothetical protein VF459_13830 [Caulobacteraceae bacterium]